VRALLLHQWCDGLGRVVGSAEPLRLASKRSYAVRLISTGQCGERKPRQLPRVKYLQLTQDRVCFPIAAGPVFRDRLAPSGRNGFSRSDLLRPPFQAAFFFCGLAEARQRVRDIDSEPENQILRETAIDSQAFAVDEN